LGKVESQICARNQQGEIIDERRERTEELGRYLGKRAPGRVILETCAEAFSVADEAAAQGHDVRVVKSKLASKLGVGDHGVKTDKRDARALSEASTLINLPSVHVPSRESRERKALTNSRDALIQARTQLINSVRGGLRPLRLSLATGSVSTFPVRVRKKLQGQPNGLSMHIERLLRVIEKLNEQVSEADKELVKLAKGDPDCRRSMTMPGVGSLTAVRFKATLDEVGRFPSAHRVESFLGLTPGEDSSSDRKRITSITKAGPSRLRWTLVQAAWSLWRTRPKDPMVAWANAIALRRGKRVAIIALARKMAGVLFAMWRDKTSYAPAFALTNGTLP
jgi:transposase